MNTIIGSYVPPFVRKVLVCLELIGLAYDIDPITPCFGDDRFAALSPSRVSCSTRRGSVLPMLRSPRASAISALHGSAWMPPAAP